MNSLSANKFCCPTCQRLMTINDDDLLCEKCGTKVNIGDEPIIVTGPATTGYNKYVSVTNTVNLDFYIYQSIIADPCTICGNKIMRMAGSVIRKLGCVKCGHFIEKKYFIDI